MKNFYNVELEDLRNAYYDHEGTLDELEFNEFYGGIEVRFIGDFEDYNEFLRVSEDVEHELMLHGSLTEVAA